MSYQSYGEKTPPKASLKNNTTGIYYDDAMT